MRYGPIPPKQLPVQDIKKVLLMAERWQRASMAHNIWAEPAKTCVDFLEGRQWTADALADMERQGRPALTFNMIAPLVRLVLGYQRQNKSDIIYRPGSDSQSSEDTAEVLSMLEKNIATWTQQQYQDAEVFLDGLVAGRGFFRQQLDFENNDFGDIKCRALDPFSVFLDPDGDTYDLNESASFITISKYLSLDQIEQCYGKLTMDLLRPFTMGQTPVSPVSSVIQADEVTPIRYFGSREQGAVEWWDSFYASMGDFVDTARKTLRVIETEHHVYEEKNVLIDLETGDRQPLPADFDKVKIDKLLWWGEQVGNPLKVERRNVRSIQNTVICGDLILYDRPSVYDRFTVTGFFPYFRRGFTQGMVNDLLDPQREKNKRRSTEIEMVSKTSNGGWSYHQDSLDPVQKQKLRNFGAAPGFTLEWTGTIEPKQLSPATPPIAHERLEQKAETDLLKIAGINESALGQLDRVQSGKALEARQRQAVIALSMYQDNFTRSKQLLGTGRLAIIQRHYTEERMFRILGEDGRIVEQIINQRQPVIDPNTGMQQLNMRGDPINTIKYDVTIGKYMATVDEAPMSATFANAQWEEMMTLLEKMGPSMAPFLPAFADLIVDMSSMPRKDDWIERFKTVAPNIIGFDPTAKPPVPATDEAGNPIIDPKTGQPIMLDPATGQPVPPQAAAPAALPAPAPQTAAA